MLTGGTRSLFCAPHTLRILLGSRPHPLWKCVVTTRSRSISFFPRPGRHASHRHMIQVPPMREHQMCLCLLTYCCNNPVPPTRERQLHHIPTPLRYRMSSTVHAGPSTAPLPRSAQEQQTSTIHVRKVTPLGTRALPQDGSACASHVAHSPGSMDQSPLADSRSDLMHSQYRRSVLQRNPGPAHKNETQITPAAC